MARFAWSNLIRSQCEEIHGERLPLTQKGMNYDQETTSRKLMARHVTIFDEIYQYVNSLLFSQGRKGRVLHTHQSFFAFLYNAESTENRGVFVTRARSLTSQAPKGNLLKLGGADLSKMNPLVNAPTGGMVGSAIGRGPRDRDIGEMVCVTRGPQKGYVGVIKDTNGSIARVELLTGNKIISIDKTKLFRRLYVD